MKRRYKGLLEKKDIGLLAAAYMKSREKYRPQNLKEI